MVYFHDELSFLGGLIMRICSKAVSAVRSASVAISDSWRLSLELKRESECVSGLVSIPIATYDRVDVLVERTIPTLLESTYEALEIIVVSDGGQVGLRRAVSELGDERVRFIQLRTRSRYPRDPLDVWFVAGSRPRNIGARYARGEFILWISDDDVVLPTAISALVGYLRENPTIDAVGGAVQVREVNAKINLPSQKPRQIGFETGAMPAWLHRRYLRAFRWSTSSWRKSWNRPADYDLAERMLAKGRQFGAIDELVAIQPEVGTTGYVGSKAAIWEEINRRQLRRPTFGGCKDFWVQLWVETFGKTERNIGKEGV